MKSKPGNNFATIMIQMGGFAGAILLAAPIVVLVIIGVVTGQVLFAWLALAAGLVLGAVYILVGIRIGAGQYDKRAPELLQAVSVDR